MLQGKDAPRSPIVKCLTFLLPVGYSPEDSKRGDACEGDSGGPFVMKVCSTSSKTQSWDCVMLKLYNHLKKQQQR